MEFQAMNAEQYRKLDDAAFEQRRAAVLAELENADSKVGMDVLDAEITCIENEIERRNKAVALRSKKVAAVSSGEGALKAASTKNTIETVRNEDPFDTEAYTRAYAEYVTRGIRSDELVKPGVTPEYVRADAFTATTDNPVFIPTTLYNQIIEKMVEYGTIYAEATKINVQGGVDIPILDFTPSAYWVTEAKPSDRQKVTGSDKVSFKYYMLECRLAQSFLQNIVSLNAFTSKFPELAARAMVMTIEQAMVNGTGSGQPLGIFKDTRVTNKVDFAAADIATWKGWATSLKTLTNPYRARGKYYMSQNTWDAYVDGLVDANGQPIARVNYGVDEAHDDHYRLNGKTVKILPEDILPSYDDAAATGAPFMLFGNFADYIINEQMGMRSVRYNDEDKNQIVHKDQIVLDGKIGDVNGTVVFNAPTKG